MSDIKIDKKGASSLEQRQLQTLIKAINPDALPKYGIDGDFGGEGRAALQEILEANNIDFSEGMSIKDAIEAIKDLPHADVKISDEPISRDTPRDQVERIQELINIIDPKLMPKGDVDGLYGSQTEAALKELLPNVAGAVGIDPATASIDDLVTTLQQQVSLLPERYVVENCDNLTEIAREVYPEEIQEYTQQIMELDDPRFPTEKAARVHAEQVAVARIAFANNLGDGVDAHIINPNDVLHIPDAGELKASDPTLDWEALDGEVGPGGPCGCDGESPIVPSPTQITSLFTPAAQTPPAAMTSLPPTITDGQCVATYQGTDRKGRHVYDQEGPSGNAHDEVRAIYEKFNIENGRSLGSCGPVSTGEHSTEGHVGNVADTPAADTPSVGL